jgi:tight adherence protein B
MGIAALVTGSIVLIITSIPIVALMGATGATFIPIFSLKRRVRVRSKALRTSWPDAVDSLASSVRAGMSLPEAVADLSKNGPASLRYAFDHFCNYYRSTGSFGQALNALQERLGDPVADRVISALRIAYEVGGTDLGQVLRTLSALLRSDAMTRGDIEARQSWTISAARMSIAAPWLTLAMLCTRPDAVAAFRTGLGAVVLLGAAAVSFIAYRIMLRIGALPTQSRVVCEVPV